MSLVRVNGADRETPRHGNDPELGGMIDAPSRAPGPKPEILGRLPVEASSLRRCGSSYGHFPHSFYFMSNVNILNLSPETQVVMADMTIDSVRGHAHPG